MKKSRYNFIRKIGAQSVLYNAMTESVTILDPAVAKLYQDKSVNEIHGLHPDFYNHLCNNGYIVNDDMDELHSQIEKWDSEDNDPHHFSLSINPTLNNNCVCGGNNCNCSTIGGPTSPASTGIPSGLLSM